MAKGPKPIGSILAELMARQGYARLRSTEAYETAWRQTVGPLAAQYSRVGSLRRGTLEVIVANSTMMQELTFDKENLRKDLARQLPDEGIKDLRFRMGAIDH